MTPALPLSRRRWTVVVKDTIAPRIPWCDLGTARQRGELASEGRVTTSIRAVPVAEPLLTGLTVQDVMVSVPKTMHPGATVADARAFFEDDHVHMALIATSGTLLGTLVRGDLADLGDDAMPALTRSRLAGRTVAAAEPAEEVRLRLIRQGRRRLAVVDETGTLTGLLCLKRKQTGFCRDADVAARAAERLSSAS
jgi:CBS domain-containing protein